MHFRYSRSAPIAELGQIGVGSRKRVVLILAVPGVSLLLPGLAVEIASAGGTGELTRIAGAVAKFLLFYSGVFALVVLSATVAAGLLAADRIIMTPEARIRAQALHRATSLTGIAALANHIMLEILASRAGILDGLIPFLSARSTLFMGLGTLSSDLFVLIILTGVLRRRFSAGGRPALWRWLHLTAYAAWPMAVLHGLLAGRSAKPYVDWSYGACLAAVALALTIRYVIVHRGRDTTPGGLASRARAGAGGTLLAPPTVLGPMPTALPARLPAEPRVLARPVYQQASWHGPQERPAGRLRALPSPDPDLPWDDTDPRPSRWAGAPWSQQDVTGHGYQDAWMPDQPDQQAWTPDQQAWTPDEDAWAPDQAGGWEL